jgi:hypothetical protein
LAETLRSSRRQDAVTHDTECAKKGVLKL